MTTEQAKTDTRKCGECLIERTEMVELVNGVCPKCSADYRGHRSETHAVISKHAYIVMVCGYWGRGKTVAEAANKCIEAGGGRTEQASIRLIVGDDKPEVNDAAYLLREPGSELFYMGMGYKLGALARIRD